MLPAIRFIFTTQYTKQHFVVSNFVSSDISLFLATRRESKFQTLDEFYYCN